MIAAAKPVRCAIYTRNSSEDGLDQAAGSLRQAPALLLERLVRERGAALGFCGCGSGLVGVSTPENT